MKQKWLLISEMQITQRWQCVKTLYVEFQLYIGQGERILLMVNPTEMIFLRTFSPQAKLQFTCIDMNLSNLTSF